MTVSIRYAVCLLMCSTHVNVFVECLFLSVVFMGFMAENVHSTAALDRGKQTVISMKEAKCGYIVFPSLRCTSRTLTHN